MNEYMSIEVTLGEILDKGVWLEWCEKYGMNEWIINEGLAESSDTTKIKVTDAIKWGLLNET